MFEISYLPQVLRNEIDYFRGCMCVDKGISRWMLLCSGSKTTHFIELWTQCKCFNANCSCSCSVKSPGKGIIYLIEATFASWNAALTSINIRFLLISYQYLALV